jgi:hypothetical protein
MDHSRDSSALHELVRELDILIRARYPLIAVNTFEEVRFRHLMTAVTELERHRPKGCSSGAERRACVKWQAPGRD